MHIQLSNSIIYTMIYGPSFLFLLHLLLVVEIYINVYLFWEGEGVWAGEGAEREKEREEREYPKQRPFCQCRARRRAQSHEPWDYDLSWNQELDSWPTESCRHPCFFLFASSGRCLPPIYLGILSKYEDCLDSGKQNDKCVLYRKEKGKLKMKSNAKWYF